MLSVRLARLLISTAGPASKARIHEGQKNPSQPFWPSLGMTECELMARPDKEKAGTLDVWLWGFLKSGSPPLSAGLTALTVLVALRLPRILWRWMVCPLASSTFGSKIHDATRKETS